MQERENGCARLQQLEDEQRKVREEQQQHQEQLARFLTQFQEEVRKVQKLQQSKTLDEPTVLQRAVGGLGEPKSIKPPVMPLFSEADAVPKDEASCEQWVWQAKEALKSCTAGAVRIAIIQSVCGEVYRLEGPKWGQGTSKPKQRSQSGKEAINVERGTQGVWGGGGWWGIPYIIIQILSAGLSDPKMKLKLLSIMSRSHFGGLGISDFCSVYGFCKTS